MRDNSAWDSVCARLGANALYAAALLWALLLLSVGAPQAAHAAIGYVQGAYATPGTASSMSLAFSSAQTAGDLNVLIVAWGDSTSTVASVVDSKGNTYAAAGAITASSGNESQQIFYAKNVVAASAGANTVTVTFSNSVIQAEVRMAEYSGIDTAAPLDGFSGAVGTGLTQNSGSLTTTNANDLLVAGNGLASVTTAAGTGYTLRMTTGEGEILEDETVATAGSYSAGSTQQTSGYWLIQVAAFKAAATAAPTISSFTPASGSVGTVITVTGTNLGGSTTTAWVGSAHDASLANVSSTSVTITVPADAPVASDQLSIIAPGGQVWSGSNFTVTGAAAPTITSFTPTSGPAGTVITITGTNLSGATTTAWVGAAHDAPLTNVSSTSVKITVPSDAATGADQLAVFTAGGTVFSGSNFTVTAATPSITSFTPTSGPVGTVITVTGTNLSGATLGWVGTAHDATATNVSSTTVQITVPADAATGADQLGLVYSSGTVLSATNFTVTAAAAPTISSFTPASGPVGTVITVIGTNLGGSTTTAWVGSAHDASLANVSSTSVTISVPSDAPVASDQLSIIAPGGQVWSGQNFTVTAAAAPTITSFTPASGPVGTVITVTGTNLSGATTTAWVGAAHDAALTNVSSTSVNVTVPADAPVSADQLTVFTAGGTAFSGSNFTVTASSQGPTAPSGLTATAASSSQINLSWTASTDPAGVTGYLIQRCQGASCSNFAQIASVAGTVTTYSNTSLAASTSYSYRVQATDAAANLSAFSGTATTSTPSGSDTAPPTAPTGLTATAASTSQINLGWMASTDNVGVTGYRVERCVGTGCSGFAQIATSTTTSYPDPNLTAGTSYSYRVRATDAAGNLSGYSSVVSTPTSGTAPIGANSVTYGYDQVGRLTSAIYSTGASTAYNLDAAGNRTLLSTSQLATPNSPTNLRLQSDNAIQVILLWTASTTSGITGYQVFRNQTAVGSQLGNSATTYTDNSVVAGTQYTYTVLAYVGTLASSPSNSLLVTPPAVAAPTVPTALTAAAFSYSQINLTWGSSTDSGPGQPGLAGYHIYRGTTSSNLTLLTSVTATSYNDASAASGTAYYYAVASYDTAGRVSSQTSPVPVTTLYQIVTPAGYLTTAAATIYNMVTTMQPQQGFNHYTFYQTYGSVTAIATESDQSLATCNTSTTVINLATGYSVAGDCSVQAPASVYNYQILPSTPVNFAITVNSYSQMTVTWSANTLDTKGPGLGGFIITRNGVALSELAASTVSYIDSGLTPSTSYTYSMVSVDKNGVKSNPTASITNPTPAITIPPIPTNFTAVAASATQYNLTWTEPAYSGGSGVKNFIVMRQIGAAGTPAALPGSPTTSTSISDTNVVPGTAYIYSVAAQDNSGQVSPAASVSPSASNYSDTPVMTDGTTSNGSALGFISGSVGLMSPAKTTNGYTYVEFIDRYPQGQGGGGDYSVSQFEVSGFTADPGQAWLISVSTLGITKTGASATYLYSSGTASWVWPAATPFYGFGFGSSGTNTCTIVHK